MSFNLDAQTVAGAILALLTALVGAAQWARRAYLQRASDLARETRIHAENRAREEEQKAAEEHTEAVAEAADARQEAEDEADTEAAEKKAAVTTMSDDEAINEAARLAAERGWR